MRGKFKFQNKTYITLTRCVQKPAGSRRRPDTRSRPACRFQFSFKGAARPFPFQAELGRRGKFHPPARRFSDARARRPPRCRWSPASSPANPSRGAAQNRLPQRVGHRIGRGGDLGREMWVAHLPQGGGINQRGVAGDQRLKSRFRMPGGIFPQQRRVVHRLHSSIKCPAGKKPNIIF